MHDIVQTHWLADGLSVVPWLILIAAFLLFLSPSSFLACAWQWCTGPGLGGCKNCSSIQYDTSTPLIFNVGQDPSEAAPLEGNDAAPFQAQAVAAYTTEVATFTREQLISPPGQPDEKQPDGSYKYAILARALMLLIACSSESCRPARAAAHACPMEPLALASMLTDPHA